MLGICRNGWKMLDTGTIVEAGVIAEVGTMVEADIIIEVGVLMEVDILMAMDEVGLWMKLKRQELDTHTPTLKVDRGVHGRN